MDVGHSLENDFRVLGFFPPRHMRRDTAHDVPRLQSPAGRPRKLRHITWEFLGLAIQDSESGHDPLEDARAALLLYQVRSLSRDLPRALSSAPSPVRPLPCAPSTCTCTCSCTCDLLRARWLLYQRYTREFEEAATRHREEHEQRLRAKAADDAAKAREAERDAKAKAA